MSKREMAAPTWADTSPATLEVTALTAPATAPALTKPLAMDPPRAPPILVPGAATSTPPRAAFTWDASPGNFGTTFM